MQYRHPPIQEHLVYSHIICMYMYNHVHICNIYSAYMCVSTFHYCGEYRGKIPDAHSNPIYLVLKHLKKTGMAFQF